jgi:hypothetical protein
MRKWSGRQKQNSKDSLFQIRRRMLILGSAGVLVLVGLLTVLYNLPEKPVQLTFAECQAQGGTAWRVDPFDPGVCPACQAYLSCSIDSGNPDCIPTQACAECLEANFPYPARCPGSAEKLGEISDAAIWFLCCGE